MTFGHIVKQRAKLPKAEAIRLDADLLIALAEQAVKHRWSVRFEIEARLRATLAEVKQ